MANPSDIRVVSFDGDGTLWDFEKVMRHSLGFALRELERLDPPAAQALSVGRMIELREALGAELEGRVTNLEAVRLECFRRTLAAVGRPNDRIAARLNAVYLKHRFEDIELFGDVLPTLEALRAAGYAFGLLSNGNTYPRCVGLDGAFAFVVFSQDHGVAKPDRGLFEVALREAGCPPDHMVHVGDSLEADVGGARNAGVRSVWLNRNGLSGTPGMEPDHEISSLGELPSVLNEAGG